MVLIQNVHRHPATFFMRKKVVVVLVSIRCDARRLATTLNVVHMGLFFMGAMVVALGPAVCRVAVPLWRIIVLWFLF
jgi:hypothetical protein